MALVVLSTTPSAAPHLPQVHQLQACELTTCVHAREQKDDDPEEVERPEDGEHPYAEDELYLAGSHAEAHSE